jgi:hypothetical protein
VVMETVLPLSLASFIPSVVTTAAFKLRQRQKSNGKESSALASSHNKVLDKGLSSLQTLYKSYNNQLLDVLRDNNIGAKIALTITTSLFVELMVTLSLLVSLCTICNACCRSSGWYEIRAISYT